MNHLLAGSILTFVSIGLQAQVSSAAAQPPDPTLDQIVDRAIANEGELLKRIRSEHPIVETYVQEMQPDSDLGAVPRTDHYFLGKLDSSKRTGNIPFVLSSASKTKALEILSRIFSLKFSPQGFDQIMSIDGGAFDRSHYEFALGRREFLGNVRTWVLDISPRERKAQGRFLGRIWIEDRGFNIVRFNGVYTNAPRSKTYVHFDSWRVNCGPDLWLPYETYSEESALHQPFPLNALKTRFKAVTHIWGYTTASSRSQGEQTSLTVELPSVQDKSDEAADYSPVESLRAWEHESERNILDRMEKANLLAPRGEVDKVLDTVVNNLIVTNQLTTLPEVRTRVILTTPLETFVVGHTIVISRGLLDTLPNEASLAAMLAHELAHIALGQQVDTKFAFSDRVLFSDEDTLKKLRSVGTQKQEDDANQKAVQLLESSPYKENLGQAGLFLRALDAQSSRLPSLINPLLGNRIVERNGVLLRLAALLEKAPQLQTTRTDQVAALPLGARTMLNPWTNQLRMTNTRAVPLLAAREKMAFELTPISLNLKYQARADKRPKEDGGAVEGSLDAQDSPTENSRRTRVH